MAVGPDVFISANDMSAHHRRRDTTLYSSADQSSTTPKNIKPILKGGRSLHHAKLPTKFFFFSKKSRIPALKFTVLRRWPGTLTVDMGDWLRHGGTYTSGHDSVDAEEGSCLMNTHWNTVWSNGLS